ncbi:putative glutathione S-transferase [Silene latifolia]|uniref:putative glutathione S-transferase n=1 Tax=Silene latifolia TaxID=37657 RepID=UPI003D781FFD
MQEVKVYGVWGSPFSRRVEIALKMKGVEYEFIEEDLNNKSEQLLMYNPVHKKIPVLVHNGKPVVESSLIMEYIDETWKENAVQLLPTDPYKRAQVRFWSKFIDDKIMASVGAALLSQGEDVQKAKEEMEEVLQVLESEIIKKELFGGDKVSFLDIIGLFVAYWVPIVQQLLGNYVLTRDKFPGIYEWADQLLDDTFIKENLPHKDKLIPLLRTRFGVQS